MKLKVCSKCKIKKSIEFFGNDKGTKDGLKCQCKKCRSLTDKAYRKGHIEEMKKYKIKYNKENKDKISSKNKEYSLKNKDKIRKTSKEWYLDNREDVLKKGRENCIKNRPKRKAYYQNNKEKIKESKKRYYIKNKDRLYEKHKAYLSINKESLKKKRREWERDQSKNNPQYKLRKVLATRVRNSFKNQSIIKEIKTMDLLGCTIEEFKLHMEKQFKKGMTWNNYGVHGWHIDHRVPCVSFDLTKESEQKACFHFTNLQPLWAFDNLSKGAKQIYLI